eukprot:m.31358 g.31358  ORF g.31358 m.31358 type:complete len:195 (+) comp10712_c0_seq2:341-925(+)
MAGVVDVYAAVLQSSLAWATEMNRSLGELAAALPPLPDPLSFDAEFLAVLVANDTDLSNPSKLASFRTQLAQFLTSAGSPSLWPVESEFWQHKDAVQILCEALLFVDVTEVQQNVTAVLIAVVLEYGRDGIGLIAFLMCLRGVYRCGTRAALVSETVWLSSLAERCIQYAYQYLTSEYAGDCSLVDLVRGLLLA